MNRNACVIARLVFVSAIGAHSLYIWWHQLTPEWFEDLTLSAFLLMFLIEEAAEAVASLKDGEE